MDTKRQLSEKIFHLKRLYNNLINISEEASEQLMEIADELDKHANNVNKAKVGGAAGAVAGGAMCAVGFGLSFVTFGASLGLVIAGKEEQSPQCPHRTISRSSFVSVNGYHSQPDIHTFTVHERI